MPWLDDRIALAYQSLVDSAFPDTKCRSARISDQQLVDIREEPLIYSRNEGGQQVIATLDGHFLIRDLNQTSSGRSLMKFYEFASRIGLVKEWSSQQYSWQATASGHPVGPSISLKSFALPTKDGQYLVEGGLRLVVFPISRRSRWPETLAVAALPWLLVAAWRTVPKASSSLPLTGRQPAGPVTSSLHPRIPQETEMFGNRRADVDKALEGVDFSKNTYQIEFDTTAGKIVLDLWPDVAPGHCKNIIGLTKIGFYDGIIFHR